MAFAGVVKGQSFAGTTWDEPEEPGEQNATKTGQRVDDQ